MKQKTGRRANYKPGGGVPTFEDASVLQYIPGNQDGVETLREASLAGTFGWLAIIPLQRERERDDTV